MYPSFAKLPEEKKALIINICIAEFAEHGYDNTSTDIITSRAGISKGILFHYFKSKKNLYLFLVDHVQGILADATKSKIDQIETKVFFGRIKAIIMAKQSIFYKYYEETNLIINAYANPPKALKKELEAIFARHVEASMNEESLDGVFRKELIASKELRAGVSIDKAFELTMMLLEQLSNKYLILFKNHPDDPLAFMEPLEQEIDACLDILQHGIYNAKTTS